MMEDFEKFYNSALRFLSYRPRSEREVRDKLKSSIKRHSGEQSESRIDSGVAEAPQNDGMENIIEKIIIKLKEKKFVNDEEFARLWIESRLRFKPRSLRLIKLELKQKGISDEIIESGVGNQELGIESDLDQAKKLVEKRIGRIKSLPKQEIYQKLGRYLASKGFSWDTIKKSIDEVLDKVV